MNWTYLSVMNMTSRYKMFTNLPLDGMIPVEEMERLTGLEKDEWEEAGLESVIDLAKHVVDREDDVIEIRLEEESGWMFIKALVSVREKADMDVGKLPDIQIVDAPSTTVSEINEEDDYSIRRIEGRVSHASAVDPVLWRVAFQCSACNGTIRKQQQMYYSDTQPPTEDCNCGNGGNWESVEKKSADVDYQRLIVEDLPENGNEKVSILTYHKDIIRQAEAGARVDVIAAIIPYQPDDSDNKLERRLVALEVENKDDVTEVDMSDEDIAWCEELARDEDTVGKLVESFAPELAGLTDAKRGLLHSMVSKPVQGDYDIDDEDESKSRGLVHNSLVGNPGCGKSKLLDAVHRLAVRSEITSAEGATGIGLTATVSQDEETGEYICQAGLLPRAHRGVAIADELDKMTGEDMKKLSRALQNGEITVDKAGVDADLPTKTVFIAASNPKNGTFESHEPLADQIDYPSNILSRFDLIYHVEKHDDNGEIARSIVNQQTGTSEDAPLSEEEMRRYIHWCRQIDVEIPDDVRMYSAELIEEMLDAGEDSDVSEWFDPRRASSILRLARCHARLNGRSVASFEDVDMAVQLLDESIGNFLKETNFDLESLYSGRSSARNDIRKAVGKELADVSSPPSIDGLVALVTIAVEYDEDVVRSEVDEMLAEDEIWVGDDDVVRLAE